MWFAIIMAEQKNIALSQLNQLNLQQMFVLLGGAAALFALVFGVWIWGQTPDYRVLYSNLSDRDGGAIIESLQQMNIPYSLPRAAERCWWPPARCMKLA